MKKSATLNVIKNCQRQWATSHGIAVSPNGRVQKLVDNLFVPLHPETCTEFEAGDGDEFGSPANVGKMYSLWSSSALVCNVFDYWRGRELSPLFLACGSNKKKYIDIRFEQKYPTGVRTARANVDVLLNVPDLGRLPVVVESKFTEPFQSGEKECLRPSYFQCLSTWQGLPLCRAVGESLTATRRFEHLDAGQLLKHIIGLTRAYGRKRFVLLYLWYDVEGSDAAQRHRDEVVKFSDAVRNEVFFHSETYQTLFRRLRTELAATPYEEYLRSRYFV